MTVYAALVCVTSGIAAGVLGRRSTTGPVSVVVALGAALGLVLLLVDHAAMPLGAARTLALGLGVAAIALARSNYAIAAALLTAGGLAALGSVRDVTSLDPVALSATGTPWSLVHILLGVGSTAATAVAAGYGALALRRSPTVLITLALLLTALPLVTRAGDLLLHADGVPLLLDVPILDTDGAQGLVRRALATWTHPTEWLLRALASTGLLLLLFASLRGRAAGSSRHLGLARVALTLVALHGAFYIAHLLPLAVEADPARLLARLLLGELQGAEALPAFALPALTSGPHAAGFPLFLSVIALGFTWLSTRRVASDVGASRDGQVEAADWTDTPDDRHTERAALLAAALLGATLLTGIGWSNYVWGGFLVPDPKLFAGVVSLGCYALFLWTRATLPRWGSARATFVLAAAFVTFWSLIGPPLGLVSPSLHDFGR